MNYLETALFALITFLASVTFPAVVVCALLGLLAMAAANAAFDALQTEGN